MTLKRVEALGYVAEEARSAADARARLAAGGIDIVLTDIVMPGDMDGVDLARWMSVHQLVVPIVFATAFSGRAAFAEVRRSRDVVTLSKPYSRKALAQGSLPALALSATTLRWRKRNRRCARS